MIFDGDVKIGKSFKRTSFMAEDYINEMTENKINRALIIAEKPVSYDLSEGNAYISSVIEKYPDKFVGAVRIDPWNEEKSQKQIEKYLCKPEFCAIYLNPWEENFQINSEIVRPIFELAQEYNKNIIVEGGYVWVSHVSQIADIAKDYPKVNILMANAGQMDLSGYSLTDVKYFMGKVPNLYLGTAAAVAADWLVDLYRNVAPRRVIFESNYPFFESALEKRRIELGFFNEEEKKEVFSKNLIEFLKIS